MKSLLIVLLLSIPAFAQTITATTAEGKKVLLASDGTWKYAPPETDANIAVEAAFIYRNGDVRPVARVVFMLLDAELGEILTAAKLTPPGNLGLITSDVTVQRILAYAKAVLNAPGHESYLAAAQKAIQSHTLKSVQTGFDGKASFDAVPLKPVWCVGVAQSASGWAVWNMKFEPKAGANKLTIDQNNAFYVYSRN